MNKTPSPWGDKKYLTKEEQVKRLPSNLGHGWDDQGFVAGSEADAALEAEITHYAGYHVALFQEADGFYRKWFSEVSSDDPLDHDCKVARWFDYIGR